MGWVGGGWVGGRGGGGVGIITGNPQVGNDTEGGSSQQVTSISALLEFNFGQCLKMTTNRCRNLYILAETPGLYYSIEGNYFFLGWGRSCRTCIVRRAVFGSSRLFCISFKKINMEQTCFDIC